VVATAAARVVERWHPSLKDTVARPRFALDRDAISASIATIERTRGSAYP
jgi:hypothetical protein